MLLPFALSRLHTVNIVCRDSSSASRCSVPTTTKADSERPLFRKSSKLSSNGTVSSALECRMIVLGFTDVETTGYVPLRAGIAFDIKPDV